MNTVDINAKGDVSIFGDVIGRDKITVNLPPPLPPAEAKDRANLLILLHKVKTFWIEGVLEKSVHNAVLLELGKETKPEAVEHPWGMVLELPDQTNEVLPPGTKIIDIFQKANRALLILGEPGSGKTITLLELACDLVALAEADPTQPIPAVFNLSSWTDKRQSLHDWLVFELSAKYQIPKRIGGAWLKDNRILPLFDGLDEVKSVIRASCVEAINHFGEIFGLPGRVICCRIKEYTALPVRLKLNSAICLQSLTLSQVHSYLDAGGDKFTALRSVLQKDETIQELAQSPLMLSIMSLAYRDLSVEDLTDPILEANDDRRRYLINIYIHRIFKRKGKTTQRYSKDQAMHWLSWLAQKMKENSQAMFLIENMQSSWLLTHWHRQVYSFSLFIIFGLIVGLTAGVFWFVSNDIFEIEKTLTAEYHYKISVWLIASLIWALSVGLIHEFKFKRWDTITITSKIKYFHITVQVVAYLVIWALIWISIWLYLWGPDSSLLRLHPLVTGGFVVLYLRRWNRNRQSLIKDIQPAEAMGWSWTEAKRGCFWGLAGGMCLWCIWIFLDASRWEGEYKRYLLLNPERLFLYSLTFLLMGTILGMIFSGLSSRVLRTKALPNQGIKLSIKNSVIAGLVFGILVGLSTALIWVVFGKSPNIGFGLGLVYLSTASFWYGGWDALMHFVLRLILYLEGNTPRRFSHFLDYATSLIFLQKVGGGYIFIHRLLLEHFADMPLQGKTEKS